MRRPRLSSGDPLHIDIEVTVRKGYDGSAAGQERAIRQWANTGATPRGYSITAVHWQNPARKDPALQARRHAKTPGEIEEARATLKRFLRAAPFAGMRPAKG